MNQSINQIIVDVVLCCAVMCCAVLDEAKIVAGSLALRARMGWV
jgi:hypothetical protein